MKTKEDVLKGKYVIDGFVFSDKTPQIVANKLIELINTKKRIVLDYGDIETKVSWNEVYDITGYVGYSKGNYDLKYPILVYNRRSYGGGSILTDCILSIKESRGKRVLLSL